MLPTEYRNAHSPEEVEREYQTYQALLDLWSKENPIKTTKLQVLLAVNALLVSAVALSGGMTASKWYVYLAGALFCFIWMLSIGRTALFQDVWQIKIRELQSRHPNDPRFSVLETAPHQKQARRIVQVFGAVPSTWYLLFSPLLFGLVWLAVLIGSLV